MRKKTVLKYPYITIVTIYDVEINVDRNLTLSNCYESISIRS